MSTRLRAASAFTAVVFRMLARDRTALFFTLLMPVIVIVIIGTTFGGEPRIRVGVTGPDDRPVAVRLVAALETADGLTLRRYADVDALRRAARRQSISIGLVLPDDLDADARAGRTASLGLVESPDRQTAFTSRLAIQGVVDRVSSVVGAATFTTARAGGSFDENLVLAATVGGQGVNVAVEDVGDERVEGLSRFSLVAPQNLILFVFINAMATAAIIVRARRAGVLHRALATRSGMAQNLAGLGIGWLAFSIAQSVLIIGIGALLFGVRWGDPASAALLVVAFAMVGCGAGLLVGGIGRNEDRVASLTPVIGIVLGALGGCMVPIEVFPGPMRAIAHAVPHFWGVQAWQRLIFDGDGAGGILTSLGVLAGFALVFLVAGAGLLRRSLTTGAP